MQTIDWNKIRQDFPVTQNITYFQSAGMSPLPNVVLRKLMEEYRKLNQFGDAFFQKDFNEVTEIRKKIASSINANGTDLAFAWNNSLAMSVVAMSLKNKFGEDINIVSMEEEFPSNSVPFEYQGIEMRYVKHIEHRYSLENILKLTDNNTRAVVTSYVQYATGFRQDLVTLGAELKKRGILFIVNGTQGFPLYSVDVVKMNVDVFTCSLHKWGFTGHIGTLFFTTEKFRNEFPSPFAGWLSVQPRENEWFYTGKEDKFELYNSADRYILGTYNMQGIMAAGAAFDYLKNIGNNNIENKILELGNYLVQKLSKLPVNIISPVASPEERSAIISFNLKEIPSEECMPFLEQRGIYTSLRLGHIRVAVNIFNNNEDIDKLCESLDIFIKTRDEH